ncbi:MAG: lysophospholipid acyltransferase family protein [Actinomycetota bacterium]
MASNNPVVVDRDRSRSFRRFGRVFSALAVLFVRIELPPVGQRPGPDQTPVIWAPNHRSMFDTMLGLIGLYRMGYVAGFFVTERYFQGTLTRWLLTRIGAIPVAGDGAGARRTIAEGVARLEAGLNLVIMAEGRLVDPDERTRGIGPLEPGVTILAKRAGRPIMPAALIGTDEMLPPGNRFPRIRLGRRRVLLVRFGDPIAPDGRSRQVLDDLTEALAALVESADTEHAELSA